MNQTTVVKPHRGLKKRYLREARTALYAALRSLDKAIARMKDCPEKLHYLSLRLTLIGQVRQIKVRDVYQRGGEV